MQIHLNKSKYTQIHSNTPKYLKIHVNNSKYSKIFECTLHGKLILATHDGRTYVSACIHNNLTHACYICAQCAPVCRIATVLVVRMQALERFAASRVFANDSNKPGMTGLHAENMQHS